MQVVQLCALLIGALSVVRLNKIAEHFFQVCLCRLCCCLVLREMALRV